MKRDIIILVVLILIVIFTVCRKETVMKNDNNDYRDLTEEEARVIINKGTEMPFSGEYNDFFEQGTYECKQCGNPLFRSTDKFKSQCGWPSFDDEIEGAIKRIPDKDGMRTEIICANCGAHLGHVFEGEQLTENNLRHCVNSVSLVFVPDIPVQPHKAYFAGGCFWGVEFYFEKEKGVLSAVSGYMGGDTENPSYRDVCSGNSGHYEVVEVTYDPGKTTYEKLSKLFFEIHDPTQEYGQGPDIGQQYLSVIFYKNNEEKEIANNLINILKDRGYDVVTRVLPVSKFYKAEDYHQDYYEKKSSTPYCHIYKKKF